MNKTHTGSIGKDDQISKSYLTWLNNRINYEKYRIFGGSQVLTHRIESYLQDIENYITIINLSKNILVNLSKSPIKSCILESFVVNFSRWKAEEIAKLIVPFYRSTGGVYEEAIKTYLYHVYGWGFVSKSTIDCNEPTSNILFGTN